MSGVFVVAVQGALISCVAIAAIYYGTAIWWAISRRSNGKEAV